MPRNHIRVKKETPEKKSGQLTLKFNDSPAKKTHESSSLATRKRPLRIYCPSDPHPSGIYVLPTGLNQNVYNIVSPIFRLANSLSGTGEHCENLRPNLRNFLVSSNLTKFGSNDILFSPPKALLVDLAQAYFKYVNPLLPFIEPTSFFELMELENPSLSIQALITVVCLTGINYCTQDISTSETKQFLGSKLLGLFSKIYLKPNIYSIQSFLLASHWQISHGDSVILKKSWYFYSIACNMCRMLGFHINNTRLSLFQQDERTRIWMTIYNTGIAYYVGGWKPFTVSCGNHDIRLWSLNEDSLVFNKNHCSLDKHMVYNVRNTTIFSAILEMFFKLKARDSQITEEYLKKGEITQQTLAFFISLNSIETRIFSWYRTIPSFLRAKTKDGILTNPSLRNPYACRTHLILFYTILDMNRLKISPSSWDSLSFQNLQGPTGKLLGAISIESFLNLSPLEKCIMVSHLGSNLFIASTNRSAVLNGPAFKWIAAFHIALFLNLLRRKYQTLGLKPDSTKLDRENHIAKQALQDLADDEKILMDMFSKGASRLSILKDSYDLLSSLK